LNGNVNSIVIVSSIFMTQSLSGHLYLQFLEEQL